MTSQEIQAQALSNAKNQNSLMNFEAIIEGFTAKGISANDITPRENVFTFNAWKALGRVVSKGQSGVKILTFIPVEIKDAETGEITKAMKQRSTTVFHISQTEELKAKALAN
ncbi:hypothetical protein K2X05_03165 [bacterium]|nr:hypothetical protein [bacterium]